MKSYYVSEVEGNNVTLTSVLEEYETVYNTELKRNDIYAKEKFMTVKMEDLKELSKSIKIFGYNSVTNKVRIVSVYDIMDLINAKLKLTNLKADMSVNISDYTRFCFKVIRATAINSYSVDENGNMVVTVSLPSSMNGVVTELNIDYVDIILTVLKHMKDNFDIDRVRTISNLIFDFECPPIIYASPVEINTENPLFEYLMQNCKDIKIEKITFTDTFNMDNLHFAYSMFQPMLLKSNYFPNSDKVFDTTDANIDLSRFSADNLMCAIQMFALWDGKITFPKLSRQITAENSYTRKNVSPDEMRTFLRDVAPYIVKGSRPCFSDCTFIGITPIEVAQIKKYTANCSAYVLAEGKVSEKIKI